MATTEAGPSDYNLRLAHAEALERLGINPFPAKPYPITHLASQLRQGFDGLQGTKVSIAGRLMPRRDHGSLVFANVEDASGQMQTALAADRLGERFQVVKDLFDTGDFVGVTGDLAKTRRGELTVWADDVTMLTKTLRTAPMEVTHAETMQRQRYLDLLVNQKTRDRFRARSSIVQGMREYFIGSLGCLEVETPILDTTYGGAEAKPFETHHNALNRKLFMRISNELYLKRLTLGFLEGVFEFSRDFRNEGMDRTHNPEFTQVELYIPFWDYNNIMNMTEDMMSGIVRQLHGTTQVPYPLPEKKGKDREVVIDYAPPWKRLSVYDGLREKLNIDPKTISDQALRSIAQEHGIVDAMSRGRMLLKLFEAGCEPDLIQPTFVKDYPTETSALTKRHRDDPELTERFEMYVGRMETMNCYTELNDPRDQRKRFEAEKKKRESGDKEAMQYDEDFIVMQEYGMPQQAGIGISIDRWTMLMTATNHIRQAILFPTLKPVIRG